MISALINARSRHSAKANLELRSKLKHYNLTEVRPEPLSSSVIEDNILRGGWFE